MIVIDCSELASDEKLALAAQISDDMRGSVLALLKGDEIVLDVLSEEQPDVSSISAIVKDFVGRRKEGAFYSIEASGDRLILHSADPIPALRRARHNELPPNLKQCPFCAFVTEYDEMYTVHIRTHGAGF